MHEFYPKGTGFPAHDPLTPPADLPLAQAAVFSLDDIGTTEIDDAFSVTRLSEDGLRIGIHIAAPGLAFAPGSPLDAIARERLSTAYMPGEKFTMLPEDVIAPLSGEIVAVNEALGDTPEAINDDPYGAGWLVKVRLSDRSELDGLMDAATYRSSLN